MSQQQLSELYRAAYKLKNEVTGQISEIENGKYLTQENSSAHIKQSVAPSIQSKIARLSELMEELQSMFDTLQEQNTRVVASLK